MLINTKTFSVLKRYKKQIKNLINTIGYLTLKKKKRINFYDINMITFICYGNICRSAFAEYYARKIFNETGLTNVDIISCGLFATQGKSATENSVIVAKQFGIDLLNHRAKLLTHKRVEDSAIIIGMHTSHYSEFKKRYPEYTHKFFLLKEIAAQGEFLLNINDPYGLSAIRYKECFLIIKKSIDILLKKIKNRSASRRKINIMFLTGALSYGGLERVVINLCNNIDRNIFHPIVVCMHNEGELAEEVRYKGVEVVAINRNHNRIKSYFSFLFIIRLIIKYKINIIHTHNTGPLLDGVLASLFFKNTKIVHTDHARNFPDKKKFMIAEKIASYFVQKIIAVSHETKINLIKYEHIEENKIDVINNGIEGTKYSINIDKHKKLKELGIEGFKNYIGTGVVLTEQKGLIHLIKAAPLIIEKFPETAFLIAGDGPVKKKLITETIKLGISDNFFFLGMRDDIAELLQLFDIYILPSEWEGLPLVILEAMVAGKCILASNVGGIPIAIKNGHNGILFEPKNAKKLAEETVKLLANPDQRNMLSQNAYKTFLNCFAVEKMMEKYEKIYLQSL